MECTHAYCHFPFVWLSLSRPGPQKQALSKEKNQWATDESENVTDSKYK